MKTADAGDLRIPREPPNSGSWAPLTTGPDGPVVFDACHSIHYRVRVGRGPLNGLSLIRDAVAKVEAATGLRFVYDGPTDQAPTQASLYPKREPSWYVPMDPVIIGWFGRNETDLWVQGGGGRVGRREPNILGEMVPVMATFRSGQKLRVSGAILLDPSDTLVTLAPWFGSGKTIGNVLLHELAHLVGLDHVNSTAEQMNAGLSDSAPNGFGPGDRRGLWSVGAVRGSRRATCVSTAEVHLPSTGHRGTPGRGCAGGSVDVTACGGRARHRTWSQDRRTYRRAVCVSVLVPEHWGRLARAGGRRARRSCGIRSAKNTP